MRNRFITLLLAASLLQAAEAVPALGQDAPPGDGTRVSAEEQKSLQAMTYLVGVDALLAGAEAACRPRPDDPILRCTRLVLQNWPSASGLAPFSSPAGAIKVAQGIWTRAYAMARDSQNSLQPPMSCADVDREAASAPVFAVCGPASGNGSALPDRPPAPAQPDRGNDSLRLQ